MQITESFLDQITAPPTKHNGLADQVFYRDSTITGFGVRVTSGNVKSFIVEKRIQGKVRRITLGKYGDLSLEQARNEAVRLLAGNTSDQSSDATVKQQCDRRITLLQAFEDYLQNRKDLKPATIHDYRRSIDGAFVHWQNKPLTEITRDMVQLRHSSLGKRSKARANNAMRVLRAIFNHAITSYEDHRGEPVITNNPVDRLNQLNAWHKVEQRRTWIKPDELPHWFAAVRQLNNETTRHYLYFLLFSGLRRSDASRLKWSDVNLDESLLALRKTGSQQMHVLPLSDYLIELLKKQQAHKPGVYVFPSDTERGYLVEPRSAVKRVSDLSGIPFTLHDLRRSFVAIAENLGISNDEINRLLNSRHQSDLTTAHNASGLEPVRESMQRITDYIIKHCLDYRQISHNQVEDVSAELVNA